MQSPKSPPHHYDLIVKIQIIIQNVLVDFVKTNDDDFCVPAAKPAALRDTLVNWPQGLFFPAWILLSADRIVLHRNVHQLT